MSSKLLRGLLNAAALDLVAIWVVAGLFFGRAQTLIWLWGVAALLVMLAGYLAFCEELRVRAELRRANEREAAQS